jgi:hypothetical protein
MSKTITIEIPAPPDGWVHEKRVALRGEARIYFDTNEWEWKESKADFESRAFAFIFAYRVRDEYSERYEALKLPDGWAWTGDSGIHEFPCVHWCEKVNDTARDYNKTVRRIVNGKAIKP